MTVLDRPRKALKAHGQLNKLTIITGSCLAGLDFVIGSSQVKKKG